MDISIDKNSGFCFGVVSAIKAAEDELAKHGVFYCLGDIVHNNREVERLKAMGLVMINHEQFRELKDCRVMIRAHGEPPETYRIALKNNIELVDASCPVVLRLQNQIRKGYEQALEAGGQIVILGKEGHAEVNGLVGQTGGNAIIISGVEDLDKIDFSKDIYLYSQTTMSIAGFHSTVAAIRARIGQSGGTSRIRFVANDTICRQVANRGNQVREFASQHDVLIFVSDKKSSNGTFLFEVCREVNEKSYFVTSAADLQKEWFKDIRTVGISGATSTPPWVMEEIRTAILQLGGEISH